MIEALLLDLPDHRLTWSPHHTSLLMFPTNKRESKFENYKMYHFQTLESTTTCECSHKPIQGLSGHKDCINSNRKCTKLETKPDNWIWAGEGVWPPVTPGLLLVLW